MAITVNLTDSEKRGLIYLCDKALCGFEKWATAANYDIDNDPGYKALCNKLTDIEFGDEWADSNAVAKLSDILSLSDDIRRWEKATIRHCWDVVSKRTGELFTVFGEPGQTFSEAMEYNGLNCEVWKAVNFRW